MMFWGKKGGDDTFHHVDAVPISTARNTIYNLKVPPAVIFDLC